MQEIFIAPSETGKGRTFAALMLAGVEADGLWPGGRTATEIMRPVWAMFGGSDQELRAFAANLQTGRKAVFGKTGGYRSRHDEKLEFLKSAGYQYTWQREAEGSLLTVYLPDLFRLDPGMVDPAGASFICLPTQAWAEAQTIDTKPLIKHAKALGYGALPEDDLIALCPMAFLFCAYLDRRTRCPLLSDGRFYLQLLLACLSEGLASFPGGGQQLYFRDREFGVSHHHRFRVTSIDDVKLVRPVAFNAAHPEIERVLSEQVNLFFQATQGKVQ